MHIRKNDHLIFSNEVNSIDVNLYRDRSDSRGTRIAHSIRKFRRSLRTLEIRKLFEKHADGLRDRKRRRETIGESEIR